MSELFIISTKACSITGHRAVDKDFDVKRLKDIFLKLIEVGIDTFLIGMAVGFDTLCFQLLEEIREEKQIKIIACIPCLNQAERFSFSQKREYERMCQVADYKVVLSEKYTPTCMQRRNEYMVNNSCVLVSYLRRQASGTGKTVRFAEKKGIKVIRM